MKTLNESYNNQVDCTCYHCPGSLHLSTILEVIQHVFDGKHCENISHVGNVHDFKYFNLLIKNPSKVPKGKKAKKDKKVKPVDFPLPFEISVFQMPANEIETKNKCYRARDLPGVPGGNQLTKQKRIRALKEYNGEKPRIPLLDVSKNVIGLLKKKNFEKRFNRILGMLDLVEKLEEKFSDPLDCKCDYCPGSPRFKTVWEVMHHIFYENHSENISYMAIKHDFDFYTSLIQKVTPLPLYIPEKPLSPEPIAAPVVHVAPKYVPYLDDPPVTIPTPPPSTSLHYCVLPLFTAVTASRKPSDTVCIGPTNIQIDYLRKCMERSDQMKIQVFDGPTMCKVCNLNLTNAPIMTIINHAFSPQHLMKFENGGGSLYIEDFEWWINLLKSTNYVPYSKSELPNSETFLGGFHPKVIDDSEPVFQKFTQEQYEFISNIDHSKAQINMKQLLNKYGGCHDCNKWFPTPMAIIRHYTDLTRYITVTKRHPVRQAEIEEIMECIDKCQLDSNGRSVM